MSKYWDATHPHSDDDLEALYNEWLREIIPAKCSACGKVLTSAMNDENCPDSPYWHGKHSACVIAHCDQSAAHVDELPELSLLDQPWSWRGTIKMLSLLVCAALSGFFFLGMLVAAKWVLIHVFGVNL